ncbi:MAG: DUF418 domain-containing protein, partial [Vicinamibacterales bacterium]
MNIVGLGLPFPAYSDPSIIGNRTPGDYWVWAVNAVLADGKFRAIFSMLFGASVVLMAERAGRHGDAPWAADCHLRRHLWLILFGLVHAYVLIWPGEILFTYAIAGLPLFAFRRLRPRTLIIMGAIVLALQAPKMVLHNAQVAEAAANVRAIDAAAAPLGALTPAQDAARQAAMNTLSGEKPTADALRTAIESRRGSYIGSVAAAAGTNLYLQSTYLYKIGFWDAVGPMLIGMALVKRGVFSAARSNGFYLGMALAGYAVGLPLDIWMVADWTRHGFAAGSRWVSLDEVTRMSIAFGHIAVVMRLCKLTTSRASRLMDPLAAAGRMALTNYVMQTVICVVIFSGLGFGWYGAL